MRKKKWRERLAQLWEVEQEVVSPLPVFVIRGDGEVEVEGCGGILEYEPERVVVAVKGGRFTVIGRELMLSDFRSGILYIRGEIKAAAFGDLNETEGLRC